MADSTLDIQQLLNATCNDRELAAQVVGVFIGDIPTQIADLKTACANGDVKTAERVAHSIKGASATVGANVLRETAMLCEQAGRENNLDVIVEKIPVLESDFASVSQALAEAGFIE